MVVQVPTAAKIKVIERELAIRRNVYPQHVRDGKMQQQEADYQIEVMEAVLDDYRHRAKLLRKAEDEAAREEVVLSREDYIKQSDGDFD
ncbi:MAG TPA: hypothetical protein VGJ20_20560 [Xanthobacteraceae bacterium]|jgi:hypothetical protein